MAIHVSPDLSASGPRSCVCSRQNTLEILHMILVLLSLWYCKLLYWDAAEACYVDPCYEGPGLEELWKVNKGITFTGESSGVFALAHALFGYLLLSRNPAVLEDAHFVVGVYAGATLCASLLSLNMVYVWGAETNLMINLSKLRESNDVFDESDRHMLVVHSLIATFLRLSSISSCMCFGQICVLVMLLVSRKEVIRRFGLLTGASVATGDDFEAMPLVNAERSSPGHEYGDPRATTATTGFRC